MHNVFFLRMLKYLTKLQILIEFFEVGHLLTNFLKS